MASEASFRVLISDSLSPKGVALLESTPGIEVAVKTGMSPGDLAAELGDYDGLIVRSATKVTAELLAKPGRLKVIGRAGTGVDNIDLKAATTAGVVVINTPGGNSIAAAEHTCSLLLALARNVAQANMELREGRWERKKYMGVEVAGKTLGVVGLGRIGREVARRGQGVLVSRDFRFVVRLVAGDIAFHLGQVQPRPPGGLGQVIALIPTLYFAAPDQPIRDP